MAQQLKTAREAALIGRNAQRILLGGCTADPVAVINAIIAEPDIWQNRTLTGAFIPGVNDRDYTSVGMASTVETIFSTIGLRRGSADKVQHLPLHYSDFEARLARPGFVDLIYLTVPPPAKDGSIGLGLTCDFAPAAIAGGAALVGIINPNMPDMPHGPRLNQDRFAALVRDDAALPELQSAAPDAASVAIADHVIGLLRPGDTLQFGLGKLQGAVLSRLAVSGLGDLGYHAGMLTEAMVPLVRAGQFGQGVTTGVALGTASFYAAIRGMDGLKFAPVKQTHGIAALAAIPAFVAINSVIEVDLTGQANGEALGGQQISGQGGLVDFMRGAKASSRGRAILALPASADGGRKSRIVRSFDHETPVSVARADADIVVTEYGVAHLREASLAERAARLTAIAAPAFRDQLAGGR